MQETPEQYIQRMLGLLGGQAPLKIQADTPRKLGRLIRRHLRRSCASGRPRGNGPPRKSSRTSRTVKS